jgi:multidrug resistance protein, MATE family
MSIVTPTQFQAYKSEALAMLKLGVPIIISQLGMIGMGVADTIQVGSIEGNGAASVAASGLSNSLFFTIGIIGMSTLGVVAPMISKAKAEGNPREVNQLFRAVKRVAIFLAIATSILILLLGQFLHLLGQDTEVVTLAKPYNVVIAFSVVPLFWFIGLRQLSDGVGRTGIAMFVTLTALLLNVLLNWIFINGIAGFPRWGLFGAGVATLLSRLYMVAAIWLTIRRDTTFKPYLDIPPQPFRHLIKRILTIGLPAGAQGFFEVAVFAGAVVIIGWYGKYQQAAHQIAINLCSVTYMMVVGIASAGGIRVGHYWGLGDRTGILRAGRTALALGGSFMFCCGLIFIIVPSFFIHLYSKEPEVISVAITLLMVGGLFQLSDGLQATALGILRGVAEVNVPTIITLFAYWGVGLPIGYYLGEYAGLKAAGVWLGLTAGLTASAILLTWRFFSTVKKNERFDR